MEKNKRNAIICACLTAIVAMDGPLTNSIFSYILDSYPDVSENIQYLFFKSRTFCRDFFRLAGGAADHARITEGFDGVFSHQYDQRRDDICFFRRRLSLLADDRMCGNRWP